MSYPRILAAVLAASIVTGVSAQTCLTTLFAGGNGGSVGGVVYFDITVTNSVRIVGLETNYSATVNTAVGMNVYTAPKTSIGKETNKSLWTLVGKDDGKATSAGTGLRTKITLASSFILTPGTYGIALESVGSGHTYTNGTSTNANYKDSNIALALGKATNLPFSGTPFSPRIWNGSICYFLGKGLFTNFTAAPASGPGPLKVQFTDTTYTSSASGVKGWAWDLDGDNKVDSTLQNPVFTYPKTTWDATYDVTLTTTDGVNPASKLTKKAFITVDPSNAAAVDFGSGSTNKPITTPIGLPAMTSIFSSATLVRGFYFQAPATMVITGFEAPNEYTVAKQTHQTITCYVLAKAPPAYATTYTATAADVKFHATGLAGTVLKPTKVIVVTKGQWVGVLGACHLAATTSLHRTAYASGGYKSTVLGQSITLNRLIMQVDHRANKGLGPISADGTASIARVHVHVAGNNTAPTMTTIGLPSLGTTPKLDIQGKIAGAQGGILLMGVGRLPVPVPTQFGNLLILPPFYLSVFVANGTGQIPLPVPSDTTLKGVTLDFQSLIYNLTTNTFGTTNGTEWFIGK